MNRFLAALALVALSIDAPAEITRGPYLQQSSESGVTIVWRAGRPMDSPRVTYWIEGAKDVRICAGDDIAARTVGGRNPLSNAPQGTVQYEATITGLGPSETFRYAIHDGGSELAGADDSYRFKTHPPKGRPTPTRIWVVGDSGTGEIHQRMVHRAMLQYTAAGKRPIDLYLHVGDMAYGAGTDEQFQTKFFKPYQQTLRHTVCWASLGNHEGQTSNGKSGKGPFFDAYVCPTQGEAGGVASGREDFYSFNYGDIHFICLNSYDIDRRPGGEMARWLVRDLAAMDASWIVAFWHHPPYTKGTHNSDVEVELVEMRKYIMPILEKGGVDLVLSGHSHIYERSMLIDGAYQTPTDVVGVVLDDGDGRPAGDGAYRKSEATTPHNGTVAVVTGHGGALGRNSIGVMPIMRSIILDHGSTIIDIDGDTLTGTMLDLRGAERDQFAIKKSGVVKHSVVSNPWRATRDTQERTGAGVLGSLHSAAAAKKSKEAGETHIAALMPEKVSHLIAPHAEWDYLAGGEEPETEMWTKPGFDSRVEGWKSGTAGFGYGDGDDRTVIRDMQNRYTTLFIRQEFEIPAGTDLKRLGLAINYDDGFVLHVNGREILSKHVTRDPDGSVKVSAHEADGSEYYSLAEFADAFKIGRNVIALEGHNSRLDSSDLSLDPYLVVESGN